LPPALRVGVFAQNQSFPAWLRFSNGGSDPNVPDTKGDIRGMAIKLMGVPGKKLLPTQADARTQDFVMMNNREFYIEGLKDYVIIRQDTGRVITLQTMKSLEDRLPETKFRRVHRSYIVNIKRITAILGNMVELMEGGKIKQLPIGKNYRDELLDMINENKL